MSHWTRCNCTAKQRKIRFEDDATHDPDAEEKDTRVKYKAKGGSLTALQSKMLQLAGQPAPASTDEASMSRPEDDRSILGVIFISRALRS